MSDDLTLEQAIENIYASLKADNADLLEHIGHWFSQHDVA